MTSSEQLPVSIITGFLGSGKTTLLNQLVQHPATQDVVVLVNEFGEIGLDHLLIETITDEILLLQSGCICCQMSGDFASTLIDLHEKRMAGEISKYSQVLVETTGIADPAPIIETLLSNPQLVTRYRPGTVVATVDTVLSEFQLGEYPEIVRQVSLADKLIFTKVDLSDPAKRDSLRAKIRRLNPSASISEVANGKIEPGEVFTETSSLANRDPREVFTWLGNRHSNNTSSFSISFEEAINWPDFVEWFDDLLFSRSRQILRVKGLLQVAGKRRPVVIQSAQHMVYPPIELQHWPGDIRESVLVFITCDLSRTAVESSVRQFFSSTPANGPLAAKAYA